MHGTVSCVNYIIIKFTLITTSQVLTTFHKHQMLKAVATEVALVRSEDFPSCNSCLTGAEDAGKPIQQAVGNLMISAFSIAGGQLTQTHTAELGISVHL